LALRHSGVLLAPTKGFLMNSEFSRQLTTSNRINGADDVAPPAYSLIEQGQPKPALPAWAVPFDSTSQGTSNQCSSTTNSESPPPRLAPPVESAPSTIKLLKMCYEQTSALTRSSEQFQVNFILLSLNSVLQIQDGYSQLTFCYRKSSVRRVGYFPFRETPPL
jgi:hypothetical protein